MDSRRESRSGCGLLVGAFLITGCSKEIDVSIEPDAVEFGQIDFVDWPSDMPTEGYGATAVSVTNLGEDPLGLTLMSADFDRLCVFGITESMVPYSWPSIDPGNSILVQIGVCAYLAEEGERDTLISDELVLRSEDHGGEVRIPWSFTPVINQSIDTGF